MTDLENLNDGPPVDVHPEHIKDDNYVYNELKKILIDSRGAFGKLIADGTRNIFDFPSHYKFSPERLRLFENGTRINPQYVDDPRFSDEPDIWRLSPNAGDNMHIESAESTTYLINYVIDVSHAFKLNQSLQEGDIYRFGAFNGVDGWVMEQRGSDHTDYEVDIIEYRNGNRKTLESNAELTKPLTTWQRYELNYNWYNVGAQKWVQTYTEDGYQFNEAFAYSSSDGVRGPQTGNLPIWTEIEAGPNTDNLELEAGSLGAIVLGSPRTVSRSKPQPIQVETAGTNDTWEPVYAVRLDPEDKNVNAQFKSLEIIDFGPNDDCELIVVAFDPDNTDIQETDWQEPEYHHHQNSAVQDTFSVSEVANANGTQKVLEANEKFGGYTLLSAISVNGGNIQGSAATASSETVDRNNLLESDHYVFLARTDTAGTLWFNWRVTQNW